MVRNDTSYLSIVRLHTLHNAIEFYIDIDMTVCCIQLILRIFESNLLFTKRDEINQSVQCPFQCSSFLHAQIVSHTHNAVRCSISNNIRKEIRISSSTNSWWWWNILVVFWSVRRRFLFLILIYVVIECPWKFACSMFIAPFKFCSKIFQMEWL